MPHIVSNFLGPYNDHSIISQSVSIFHICFLNPPTPAVISHVDHSLFFFAESSPDSFFRSALNCYHKHPRFDGVGQVGAHQRQEQSGGLFLTPSACIRVLGLGRLPWDESIRSGRGPSTNSSRRCQKKQERINSDDDSSKSSPTIQLKQIESYRGSWQTMK